MVHFPMVNGPWRQPASQRAAFTLIEILVVVAILAMIASVGMIQLSRARMTTFEQLALVTLRYLQKSCHQFYAVNNQFPASLLVLTTPASNPPYIEPSLAGDGLTVNRQGYVFTYASPNPDEPANPRSFRVLADPRVQGVTGERHFSINQSNQIFFSTQHPANPSDPMLP